MSEPPIAVEPLAGVRPLASPEGCHLWLIDLCAPIDPAAWQACSAHEHTRAARFHFERDARRYRAAHAQMRSLLAQLLKCAPVDVSWQTSPQGKPLLSSDQDWHFNLSHSGEWALLGVSQGRDIGVDIECHRPDLDHQVLAREHFTAPEAEAILNGDEGGRATRFYRTWVCKEAALKAAGLGLTAPLRAVPVSWQSAWHRCHIDTPEAALHVEVHGLILPIEGEAVEAAVALIAD